MNYDDKYAYWAPACERLFDVPDFASLGRDDYYNQLDTALGVNIHKMYSKRPKEHDLPLPEETKRLLKALAGPHGKAILKVYRIQNGLEK